MRYDDTVKKFEAWVAKEPELRQRYLKAMDTLQVPLPPLKEEFLPYRKPDDLFRTARRLREGAQVLGDMGLEALEAAESVEKYAIAEKARIHARRELREITVEQANDMMELMNAFLADGFDMMHHLKKLSKIEKNPNGYYTQQYRQIHGLYRQAMSNLYGGKARGRSRGKARAK